MKQKIPMMQSKVKKKGSVIPVQNLSDTSHTKVGTIFILVLSASPKPNTVCDISVSTTEINYVQVDFLKTRKKFPKMLAVVTAGFGT